MALVLTLISIALTIIFSSGTKDNLNKELLTRYVQIVNSEAELKLKCARLNKDLEKCHSDFSIKELTIALEQVQKQSIDYFTLANAAMILNDYEEASILYCKAAEQGNFHAQFYLGHLYLFGVGVQEDHDEAYYWICNSINKIFKNPIEEAPVHVLACAFYLINKS